MTDAPPTPKPAPKDKPPLSPNMLKVLKALKSGREMTAAQLATATGLNRGKRLPELVDLGLIKELVPAEGERGKRFQITAAGKKAI